MAGVVHKHKSVWDAYVTGIAFLIAGGLLLWVLVNDWARFIPR
jgi:hypothetical protein